MEALSDLAELELTQVPWIKKSSSYWAYLTWLSNVSQKGYIYCVKF